MTGESSASDQSVSEPYVDYDGDIIWRNAKGQYHRLDGPAWEWPDGYKAWYIDDKKYSEEEWREKVAGLKKVQKQ